MVNSVVHANYKFVLLQRKVAGKWFRQVCCLWVVGANFHTGYGSIKIRFFKNVEQKHDNLVIEGRDDLIN